MLQKQQLWWFVVRCREPDAGRERHVCVCVCVCVHAIAHPCTQPHTCMCMCVHPCTHLHMCIYVCAHTHARIPAFMDIPLRVCARICTHIFFFRVLLKRVGVSFSSWNNVFWENTKADGLH